MMVGVRLTALLQPTTGMTIFGDNPAVAALCSNSDDYAPYDQYILEANKTYVFLVSPSWRSSKHILEAQ
jgi:hypothetical protein